MKVFFLITAFLACSVWADPKNLSPLVTTTTGSLRGHLVDLPNSPESVYEFSAIPFAEPPIGDLRFKKTVPKKAWTGEYLATTLPPQCPQFIAAEGIFDQTVNMSEDCLFLNIWVRKSSFDVKTSALPVILWVHGGGFTAGSTTMTPYNGTVMASFENVVFVSIQYRLGPLGFAYLGTEDVPGNQAMWDMLEALKWTYNNIAKFGGNPKRITVNGESAGGVSVATLLLSPHVKPYVHQAIVQSGTALSAWGSMTTEQALYRTNKMFPVLARKFPASCKKAVGEDATTEDKVNCLMTANTNFASFLVYLMIDIDQETLGAGVIDNVGVGPIVDGDFVPYDPIQMIADGNFTHIPIMMGTVKDEGTFMMENTGPYVLSLLPTVSNPNVSTAHYDQTTFRTFINNYFVYFPVNGHKADPIVKQAIENQYWSEPGYSFSQKPVTGDDVIYRTSAAVGDAALICPTIAWADAFTRYNNVYQFMFAHRTEANAQREIYWYGVKHSSELQYTLGDALNENLQRLHYTDQEKRLCRLTMQYLANFVRSGNPNQVDNTLSDRVSLPNWPLYSTGRTLKLDGDGSEGLLLTNYKQRDCKFWMEDLPRLAQRIEGKYEAGITTTPCPQPPVNRNASGTIFASLFMILLSITVLALI